LRRATQAEWPAATWRCSPDSTARAATWPWSSWARWGRPGPVRERVAAAAKRRGGPDLPGLVARAARDAADLGDEHVGCEHLLLALVADADAPAAKLLARLGADPAMVGQATRSAAAAASYTRANSLAGNTATALADIQARLSRLERR